MSFTTGQTGTEIVYNRGALNAKQAIVNQIDRIGQIPNGAGDMATLCLRFGMAVGVFEGMLSPYFDEIYKTESSKLEHLSKSNNLNESLKYTTTKFHALMGLLDRNNLWLESSEYEEIDIEEDEKDGKSEIKVGQANEAVRDRMGSEAV